MISLSIYHEKKKLFASFTWNIPTKRLQLKLLGDIDFFSLTKKEQKTVSVFPQSQYKLVDRGLFNICCHSQRYLCKEVGTLYHRPLIGVTINSVGSRTLIAVSNSGNQSAKYKSNIIGWQAQCHRSIALVKGTRCALKFNYRTRRLHRSRKQNTESAGKTE